MTNKKVRVSRHEKIANDFLLQFAYGIAVSILLLFIYNGSMYNYGGEVGSAMPKILWTLFALTLAAAVTYTVLWKRSGRNGFKIAAIYLYATAGGFFWCVGLQKIAYFLGNFLPFLRYFANTKRLLEMLFMLIGLSLVAEIGVYFYRIKNLKPKRGKNAKKKA
jgi:hypothetical protein